MRMLLGRLLSLAILVVIIQSCGSFAPLSVQATPRVGVDAASISPMVTPDGSQAFESVLPTPTDVLTGAGTFVQGTLFLFDPVNIAPEDDGVFLVPIEQSGEEGVSFAVPTIGDTAIRAEVDETNGDFLFRNVAPGFYALVVRTVNGQQVSVRDSETQMATFVDVPQETEETLIELGQQRLP